MKPENKQLLDQYRNYHTTLVKAGYMMGLDGSTRSNMVRIITEEFQPGYATDLWCPPCVSDMVLLLYRHYDTWLANNPETPPMIEQAEDEPELVTDPTQDFAAASEPVVIKANFPKHQNRHRR